MRRHLLCVLLVSVVTLAETTTAAELEELLGRWTWQDFKIEVRECAGKRVCAKVIAGPKNVGMELFASELTSKDGAWYGRIVSPGTGATYNTRMQFTATRTWRLDGCTASGVCLTGEFVRSN
jgi:uncharacterized protein (DUF2147 family)